MTQSSVTEAPAAPGTLPLKPIDTENTRVAETVALRAELDAYVAELVEGGLQSIYFIGAGGSLICSYPAHYLLTRLSDVPAFQLQSDEFNCAPPALMGPRSLAVLASYTGTTKETVAAARQARETGATVITAAKADSPLAAEATRNFAAKSDVFEFMIGYAVLKATGRLDNAADVDASLAALPQALHSAVEQADRALAETAADFKDDPITYVYGSGPSQAWAYGFAMCYLQEMQWMHAAGYNAGEFLQGAFEVVDDDSATILWLAEDASRPVALRTKAFLERYAKRTHYIDTAELELPGIADSVRGDFSTLVIGALASRLAQHYESVRGHDLQTRRYMFKVDY